MSKDNKVEVAEVEAVEVDTMMKSSDMLVAEPEVSSTSLSTAIVDETSDANDRFCIALRTKEADTELHDVILEELAIEISSLKSLRISAADSDIASKAILSEKRIVALEKAAKMISTRSKERRDKGGGQVDFYSENFQNVLELMTTLIISAVEETGMAESSKERFLLKLQQKLTGFEEMADAAYKGKSKKDAAKNASTFAKTR